MNSLGLLLLSVLLCVGTHGRENLSQSQYAHQRFEEYIAKYDKSYSPEEYQFRFEVFEEKLRRIEQLNEELGEEVHAIDFMADQTYEEMRSRLGFRHVEYGYGICQTISEVPNVQVPESLDFRYWNVVSPVKDQGFCGSCYAFSVTGALESQYAMKYRQIVTLSEQQIMECDNAQLHHYDMCHGSLTLTALEFLMERQGGAIESDIAYPYKCSKMTSDIQTECHFDQNQAVAKLSGCQVWTLQNEEDLKKVLIARGPLSIALAICDSNICPSMAPEKIVRGHTAYCTEGQRPNHAVLLVGYGIENGVPYWLIKNSWGVQAHDQGYLKIEAGVNCMKILSTVVSVEVA